MVLKIAIIFAFAFAKRLTFAAEFITRYEADNSISFPESIYHPIDYRRAYNLRYEPSNRSREIIMNSSENEIEIQDLPGDEEEVLPDVETTTEAMSSTEVLSPPAISEDTASSETSSSIMRPEEASSSTAQLIGNGLKSLLYGSASSATIFQGPHHKGKGFLSLFEVFKFDNSKCSVSVSDIRMLHGICYHEFECKSLGGVGMGACASGIGVCCVFLQGCGDVAHQPIVYFESPNYPTPVREPLICVLIVNIRPNVKQVRLEFLMFELNRPTNGDCLQDQFIVSGQNMNFVVPILCGINTGQHVYIDVESAIERKIFLSIFAKGNSPRSFNVKVIQLERDLAPDGCLQYYTEPEGFVKSFNYDQTGTIVDSGEVTYFNNLNYAICIKRLEQMCSVVYSTEGDGQQFDFQIINKDDDENDIVPDGQAGAGIFNCPTDYIAVNQLRLCGERLNDGSDIDDFALNADVRDLSAGPIVLPFRSDSAYVGRGFLLAYKQELCA